MADRKYSDYVLTDCIEEPNLPEHAGGPTLSMRGARQIPGAGANFGWSLVVKPMLLEKRPHTHDADEYLIFSGRDLTDPRESFDAEIDLYMGAEEEHYVITEPTIVFCPKGFLHTPLNFRIINKPVFFSVFLQTPRFSKTQDGKVYSYDGPGYKGAPKTLDLDRLP